MSRDWLLVGLPMACVSCGEVFTPNVEGRVTCSAPCYRKARGSVICEGCGRRRGRRARSCRWCAASRSARVYADALEVALEKSSSPEDRAAARRVMGAVMVGRPSPRSVGGFGDLIREALRHRIEAS